MKHTKNSLKNIYAYKYKNETKSIYTESHFGKHHYLYEISKDTKISKLLFSFFRDTKKLTIENISKSTEVTKEDEELFWELHSNAEAKTTMGKYYEAIDELFEKKNKKSRKKRLMSFEEYLQIENFIDNSLKTLDQNYTRFLPLIKIEIENIFHFKLTRYLRSKMTKIRKSFNIYDIRILHNICSPVLYNEPQKLDKKEGQS